jgi:hypothetical protein
LSLAVSAGGAVVNAEDAQTREALDYWRTSSEASAAIDLGRSWALRGDYRRGWDYPQGFTEPLYLNSMAASVGGFLNRHVDVVFATGYANGNVGYGEDSPYESYTASAQLRYGLSRQAALFANYVYYFYRFETTEALAPGVPADFDRQSIRVGVSFWVPLAGVYRRSGQER